MLCIAEVSVGTENKQPAFRIDFCFVHDRRSALQLLCLDFYLFITL